MADLYVLIAVLVVSMGVGFALISKVPNRLHTPLMSMTNAISGITILGALVLFSVASSPVETVLGVVALATAGFNVVGGFVITDRMLGLFRKHGSGNNKTGDAA